MDSKGRSKERKVVPIPGVKELERTNSATEIQRFVVDEYGLYCNSVDGREWLASPIEILALCHDESQRNWGVLVRIQDRRRSTREVVIPFAIATSPQRLTELLVSLGVRIARKRDTHSLIWKYFDEAQGVERTVTLVSTCGWQGNDSAFVLPGQTLGDQDYRLDGDCDSLGSAGTLDEWKHHVSAACAGNSRLILSVSIAFCGPILGLLKRESFGLHLQGTSSEGKSTVGVYLVGSVWSEPERFKTTWRSTANGLEGKAAERNHLLLTLDELKQMDPEEAVKAVYTICGGTGKVRAKDDGRARKQFYWVLPFVSTGELSLADHVSGNGDNYFAGLDVRLIQIPADAGAGFGIFEDLHEFKDGDELARHLATQSKKYFGTPSRAFVSAILENKERALTLIEKHQREFESSAAHMGLGRQAQRVAGHFSLIAACGELATEFGITGWSPGAATQASLKGLSDWLSSRSTTGELEDWQILRRIRQFVEENGPSRFQKAGGLNDDDLEEDPEGLRITKRAGYAKICTSGSRSWFVFKSVFETEICAGYNMKRVYALLKERGWLQTDQDRYTKNVRLPGSQKQSRMIVLSSRVLEDENE